MCAPTDRRLLSVSAGAERNNVEVRGSAARRFEQDGKRDRTDEGAGVAVAPCTLLHAMSRWNGPALPPSFPGDAVVGDLVPYCRRIFSIAFPLASSSMSLSR